MVFEPRERFKKIICLAHNSQGFDAQFILKYLVENYNSRDKPSVILNGCKIITMSLGKVTFIDSLNYFHMPLSALPKAYGFSGIEKGTFPHLFNIPTNQNYIGPMPHMKYFSPDTMHTKERQSFIDWYNERVQANHIFDFQTEIVKYCKQDVKILRLACLSFKKIFLDCHVDPFIESTTIASACLRVYRKNFLKDDQIGVIPINGYRRANNQSIKAIYWLYYMEKKLNRVVEHAGRCREKRLREGMIVDGYCEVKDEDENHENYKGIVLQFHGCYWHGCPRCFRSNRSILDSNDESMDKKYEKTLFIGQAIKSFGYKLIEMWECAFDLEISRNNELKEFINNHSEIIKQKPLNPRDAFFGGRTGNIVKMYKCRNGEKINYVDVCSLYPYICKRGRYPIGHPKLYVGEKECREFVGSPYNINKIDGLVKCDVLPPRNLFHPILPIRMHGKLIFPLCRACAEQISQNECCHESENERILHGTWVSEELKKAVEFGYEVKKIYEIYQYKMSQFNQTTNEGGLFSGYIDKFFIQKTEASGYPSDCVTEEEKKRYIDDLKAYEGISLDSNKIKFNPGLRSVAKLCLNSLWGKFGQRENMRKTEIVTDPARLLELLTRYDIEVNGILPVNDDTLYVNWSSSDDACAASPLTNVVVAAYTTALARLKLFEYLSILDRRVLYYDTDSVIYVSRVGDQDLPIGSMLGELTDELSCIGLGTYINYFLSGGPKFYAYQYKKSDGTEGSVCKVKGIRLNYTNGQKINFASMESLITGELESVVVKSLAIRCTNFHDVVSLKENKICKPVYSKRRFVGLHTSYPFGFKE